MFAMILVVSTAIVVLATISLSGSLRTKQTRLEADRIVDNAFDGGMDTIHDMAMRGVLRPPQSFDLNVGPVKNTLTIADVPGGSSISLLGINIGSTPSEFILVSATIAYQGQTYYRQRILGRGVSSTVWQYALYDDSSFNPGLFRTLNTGSAGLLGDMWVNGNLTLVGTSHIRGDLTCTGSIVGLGLTVDGSTARNAAPITFPAVSSALYQSHATTKYGPKDMIGYTFLGADASGYPIIFVNNDLNIGGTFTGNGIIFVTGNLDVISNVVVSAGSHVTIIVQGNVQFDATNLGAYLYCAGIVTIPSGVTVQSLSGIVAHQVNMSGNLNASFDPWIRDDPDESYRMRTPGVWP